MPSIVAISDIHQSWNLLRDLPAADIFIYAGDFGNMGSAKEVAGFNTALKQVKAKHKLVIAGNHDRWCEGNYSLTKSMISNARYVEDELVEVEGIKIYLSPWTPKCFIWKFGLVDEEHAKKHWSKIPEDIDILVTHGPPYSILDNKIRRFGDKELLKRIEEIKPPIHIFGHIHSDHGHLRENGIDFFNVSMLNDAMKPVWSPTIIDI